MAKLTIYSADGNEVFVEAVDAREYVEHGCYTFEPPDLKGKEPIKQPPTFQGAPSLVVDAGKFGSLVFDDGGVFVANDSQAKWLRKAIADKVESVTGVSEVGI